MSVVRFTDPADTEALNALIHDKWFPVTRIHEEGDDRVIPFAFVHANRSRKAMFDSTLRIGHVGSWSVRDTEKIEIYNFHGLTFDGKHGCIRIKGNIPLTIEVNVNSFVVTVEIP